MSENGHLLTVNHHGDVFYKEQARLPIRYINGQLEFMIKEKWLWEVLGKRVSVPLSEIIGLELRRCENCLPVDIE